VPTAIVRDDAKKDAYLDELVQHVSRDIIISGIGERPAIVHLRDFGLKCFTSGSVCVAPRGSTRILALLKAKRYDEAEKIRANYIPLEDQRDARGPIRVLHDVIEALYTVHLAPLEAGATPEQWVAAFRERMRRHRRLFRARRGLRAPTVLRAFMLHEVAKELDDFHLTDVEALHDLAPHGFEHVGVCRLAGAREFLFGDDAHHLFAQGVVLGKEVDGVAVALAHLLPVETGDGGNLFVDLRFRDGEDLTVLVVELDGDVACHLDVLFLIAAEARTCEV